MPIRDWLTVLRQKTSRGREPRFGRGLRALSALCVMLLAASARGQELLLDLTKPSDNKISCIVGKLVGGTHTPTPVLPLGLQVVSLNANVYKEGDEISPEFLLTNKGDRPMLIPSSRDGSLVYAKGCRSVPTRPGARALLSHVALMFEDQHGFKKGLAGAFLYGVSDDPTTFISLGPGKSLRIKTTGKVYLDNPIGETQKANLAFNLPLQVAVYATFSLDDPALGNYPPLTSTNRLSIRLEK